MKSAIDRQRRYTSGSDYSLKHRAIKRKKNITNALLVTEKNLSSDHVS
jgi:hypothetical protein